MPRFKSIDGFPRYKVGDDGSVWSRRGRKVSGWRRLKPTFISSGHQQIHLCRLGQKTRRALIHRLVLEAFVGPCPDGMEARHFPDRDPTNNNLTNLSWATHFDNMADKQIHNTLPKGEKHGHAKLTEDNVREIRRRSAEGEMQTDLAKEFGVSQSTVNNIVRRKNWTHI